MKAITGIASVSFFLSFAVVASLKHPPQSQYPFHGDDVKLMVETAPEALVERLLDTHDNDPVEVMRLVDPVYGATLDEPRLLEVFGFEPAWVTEGDKLRLRQRGLAFMDITGRENVFKSAGPTKQTEWPDLRYQEKVNNAIQSLEMNEMVYNLGNLSSFFNRFYRSEYGVQSSRWVHDKLLEIIAEAPPGVHVSLETFTHAFPQASLIARFEPAGGRIPADHATKMPLVILGAHQDSANYRFPLLPAPGADDDGSGTVTILEAFRALVRAGFKPERPVEFHWYAAEEGGLLGSQDVASEYIQQHKDVVAMIQFDMTAYVAKGTEPTVTFITTDVDTSLTDWATKMATAYSASAVSGAKLFAGAGSDHMSWHRAGFPAIFATEGDPFRAFNPFIHTVDDRIDLEDGQFSFEHALSFAKVAVGFAVELGGWAE